MHISEPSSEDLDQVDSANINIFNRHDKIRLTLIKRNKSELKDKFFAKKENKINFLLDNYHVPFLKSKLYTQKLIVVKK